MAEMLWPKRRSENMRLLIAAGHGTHLSLLALRRAYRCPGIVLMRPSLPGSLFDVRIEPRHDGGRDSDRCWISDGPLNRMQPSLDQSNQSDAGLILIGGPSPHFTWDEAALTEQLKVLCDGRRPWVLSGSRRTPASFLAALEALQLPGLGIHPAATLPPGWLAAQLPRCSQCWVSPDSASMVYEALTAGCAVGVFDLPAVAGSRVAGALEGLKARQLLISFEDFAKGAAPTVAATPFAEADRFAQRILDRGWL